MGDFLNSVAGAGSPERVDVWFLGERAIAAQFFSKTGRMEGPTDEQVREIYPTDKIYKEASVNSKDHPFVHGMMASPIQNHKVLPDVAYALPQQARAVEKEQQHQLDRESGKYNYGIGNYYCCADGDYRIQESYLLKRKPGEKGYPDMREPMRIAFKQSWEKDNSFEEFCRENIKHIK